MYRFESRLPFFLGLASTERILDREEIMYGAWTLNFTSYRYAKTDFNWLSSLAIITRITSGL